jgi:hypothetical protein
VIMNGPQVHKACLFSARGPSRYPVNLNSRARKSLTTTVKCKTMTCTASPTPAVRCTTTLATMHGSEDTPGAPGFLSPRYTFLKLLALMEPAIELGRSLGGLAQKETGDWTHWRLETEELETRGPNKKQNA